jgi:hypothetical protein
LGDQKPLSARLDWICAANLRLAKEPDGRLQMDGIFAKSLVVECDT